MIGRRGYRADGVRIRDPFTFRAPLRQRLRPWLDRSMILAGVILVLGVTIGGTVGLRLPLLDRYPTLTLTVGLYLLITGFLRLR